jgi:quercetin dioxygenase-like cupin family protein
VNAPVLQFPAGDWTGVPVEQVAAGVSRQMVWGDKLMVCRLRLAPRVITAAHTHPHEQITVVVRGRAVFKVGDEQRIVSAGDVIYFAPGILHGATMLDEDVELIDIFSPVREDFLPGPVDAR